MTIADSRVVAWHTDDFATDKSATTYDKVVATRWIAKGWPVTPLVHESLLAEAEMARDNHRRDGDGLHSNLVAAYAQLYALQSRLDAVLRVADEIAADGCNYYVGQLLRAALGCATTGEMK